MAAIPRLSSALRRLASSESAAYLTSFSLAPSSSEQPVSSAVVQAPGYRQGGGVGTPASEGSQAEVSGAVPPQERGTP